MMNIVASIDGESVHTRKGVLGIIPGIQAYLGRLLGCIPTQVASS